MNQRAHAPLIALLLASVAFDATAQQPAAQLKPGLIAVARDENRSVTFIAPSPNFALTPQQSLHPQLAPAFKAEWRGLLRVLRAGTYTLTAEAPVFVGEHDAHGQPIELTAGVHPFRITFERKTNVPVRLQLLWQSEHFAREPVPASAFAHTTEPRELAASTKLARGRELFEDFGCASCHRPESSAIARRMGPDLSDVGARLSSHWLRKWLADPQHFRTNTPMPALSLMEPDRADIAAFLASLTGTNAAPPEPAITPESTTKGKERAAAIGCAACHGEGGVSLDGLGSKWRSAGRLARFLADPLAVNSHGRMPSLDLKPDESAALAAHLFQSRNTAFEAPVLRGFDGDRVRGRILVQYRGCLNCHTLRENGVAVQSHHGAPTLKLLAPNKGCLSGRPSGFAAHYALAAADRDALNAFIASPDVSPAPTHDFARLAKQLNCASCHELNGPAKLAFEANQSPPPLTDAANKLRASWLNEVLLNHKRVRPWMTLRMPHFGEPARPLTTLFAASAGAEPGEGERISPLPTPQLATAAKSLGPGEDGYACITCHDFKGRRSVGDLRGPDMVEMHARIRGDWLRRWLLDPGRIQQGTAMPAYFSELPRAQAMEKVDLLARTLAAGRDLPLPDGLDAPPKDFKLVAHDEVVVHRSFINDSSPRSIAVGFPGGLSCVFDAEACRLRYAWTGGFLDVEPLWTGRGGGNAKTVGQRVFTAANSFPLRFGAPDAEPKQVAFKGYTLVKSPLGAVEAVEFRFEADGSPVKQTLAKSRSGGLEMRFDLGARTNDAWFAATDSDKARVSSPDGEFQDGLLVVRGARATKFIVRIEPR